MASGSRQSGLESRSDTSLFDPVLTSWMTRDPPLGEGDSFAEDDELKKRERDPEGELKELFRIYDKHHDNTVCCSELGKMLCCMGMEVSDVEIANIMKALDRNGNGKIEYREFRTFIQEEMRRCDENPLGQKRAIRLAFRVFDANEDGAISVDELRSVLKNLGEQLSDREINDMLKDANINEEGKVNYEGRVLDRAYILNALREAGRANDSSDDCESATLNRLQEF